jgi:hypothetical protein
MAANRKNPGPWKVSKSGSAGRCLVATLTELLLPYLILLRVYIKISMRIVRLLADTALTTRGYVRFGETGSDKEQPVGKNLERDNSQFQGTIVQFDSRKPNRSRHPSVIKTNYRPNSSFEQ